jgi:DNA-binding transcriptional MerR regulator
VAILEKAPNAFRTISEVAGDLDVPQHVLRFWESRFAQIRPMKRGGGRRYYRPEDVDLLRGIRFLLYGEGYTIRGVQRILREQGIRFVQSVWQEGAPKVPPAAAGAGVGEDAEESNHHMLGRLDSVADREDEESEDIGEVAALARIEPSLQSTPLGLTPDPLSGAPQRVIRRSAAAAPVGLTPEQIKQLRTTLDDLNACRQLLERTHEDGEDGED